MVDVFWNCSNPDGLRDHPRYLLILVLTVLSVKKTRITPTNSNTNQREMKLVPMNMAYCLYQFDALKFVLGVSLHRGSVPNLKFLI